MHYIKKSKNRGQLSRPEPNEVSRKMPRITSN